MHAGIFTAVDDGLDEREGVELTVRTPAASTDSLKLLAAGKADFSVVDIHDLGLARERGQDVVGVGAIVQRPLAAVIARAGVRRPRDLEGRRVGVTGLPSDQAVLESVVRADGGDPGKVRTTTIGFAAVPSLAAGKVDAVVTFWNAEGVALKRRGVRTREFRVDRYGAPRYPELVLATKRSTLESDPALVRRVVAAPAGRHPRRRGRPPGRLGRRGPPLPGRPRADRCPAGRGGARLRPRAGAGPPPARGLGCVRHPLRDPGAPARRGPRVRAGLARNRFLHSSAQILAATQRSCRPRKRLSSPTTSFR